MYKIITISREFGSGGRSVGRSIAKRLQIPCYDRELIEKAAEESGLAKDYIAQEGSMHLQKACSLTLFSDVIPKEKASVIIYGRFSGRSYWSW